MSLLQIPPLIDRLIYGYFRRYSNADIPTVLIETCAVFYSVLRGFDKRLQNKYANYLKIYGTYYSFASVEFFQHQLHQNKQTNYAFGINVISKDTHHYFKFEMHG
eukprot:392460_1